MKSKIVIFLLITILSGIVLAQENITKFRFSVLDKNGNFVSSLKNSDFQFLIDKKTLPTISVEEKVETPLDVVIMVDASASQERVLPYEKQFAEQIIDSILSKDRDKVAIIKFSGEVSPMRDLTADFTKAKEQLKLIEFEPPDGFVKGGVVIGTSPFPPSSKAMSKGATSIWDSTGKVMDAFAKINGKNSRPIVILISDGVNTYGESKLKEVVFSSLKNQLPIYAVGIGDKFYDGVDKKTLEKLTERTGGLLVLPKNEDKNWLKEIKILENGLRPFYEVTFVAEQKKPEDSLQKVEVKILNLGLRKKELQIIQPQGFIHFDK